MFEIEKGIPIISKQFKKYPFSGMEIGDSFFVPCPKGQTQGRSIQSSLVAASKFAHPAIKVSTHWEETGIRCWRIL